MLPDLLSTSDLHTEIPLPQNDSAATYSRKITRADLLIDWQEPAGHIIDRIRAFSLEPGAYQILRGKMLKIMRCEATNDAAQDIPGSIQNIVKNTGWSINCADCQILVTSVQPAGKPIMDAWAFHLGARLMPGELFFRTNDL